MAIRNTLATKRVIVVAVWATMGSPILYRRRRPGLSEWPIGVWKVRTMTDTRDEYGELLPDDGERLTARGRFLRALSLDELPQFFIVLCGDLSLVAPRPLLSRYLPRYTPRQRLRHAVKPGITRWPGAWAQCVDRERLERDVWYAEHGPFALDLKILLLTVAGLLQRRNVLPGGGAEFEEFRGTQHPPAEGPRAFPVVEEERPPAMGWRPCERARAVLGRVLPRCLSRR